MSISPKANKEGLVFMDTATKILQVTATNELETDVELQCGVLGSAGPFVVENLSHQIVSKSIAVKLAGHGNFNVTVKLTKSPNPGIYSVVVMFTFQRGDEKPFHILKYVRAIIDDDVVKRLQPTSSYRHPRCPATLDDAIIEHGEPPTL